MDTDHSKVPMNPEKDEEIWFDDGNIVVVAENTAFRLYKGVLSSVSPAFKNLFSDAKAEGADTMDGCPVVRVFDSPTELRHFLRVIVKPTFSILRHDYRPSFRMLAAICRIGHKYQATEAVEAASERIVLFFQKASSTKSPLTAGWADFWEGHQRDVGIRVELADAIEAVNLARLLDRPEILPFALYLCCAGHPLHMRNGILREDGTLERLSDEDYVKCVEAMPRLLARCAHDVRRLLAYYKNGHGRATCQVVQQCQEVFRRMDAEMEMEDYKGALLDLFVPVGRRTVEAEAYLSHHDRLCWTCSNEMVRGGGLVLFPDPSNFLETCFSS